MLSPGRPKKYPLFFFFTQSINTAARVDHHSSALVVETCCATSAHDIHCPSATDSWLHDSLLVLCIALPLPREFLRNFSPRHRLLQRRQNLPEPAACSRTTDAARSAGPRRATRSVYNFISYTLLSRQITVFKLFAPGKRGTPFAPRTVLETPATPLFMSMVPPQNMFLLF